jgi:hypothetical protein
MPPTLDGEVRRMRDLEQFALEGSIPDVSRDPEPGYQWSDYATRGDIKTDHTGRCPHTYQ